MERHYHHPKGREGEREGGGERGRERERERYESTPLFTNLPHTLHMVLHHQAVHAVAVTTSLWLPVHVANFSCLDSP